MKKISQTTIIKFLIPIIVILSGLLFYVLEVESLPNTETSTDEMAISSVEKKINEVHTANLKMVVGDTQVVLYFSKNQNLYEVLKENSGKIKFDGKNYSGLGFFITSIGSLHEGNGKYLIYYINGVEASSGISAYIPKDGDSIEWKLKESL